MSFKPYLKYLYIPAIILFISGVIAGLTTGIWSMLDLSFIVVGAALFIGWLIWLLITHPDFLARRSTQVETGTDTYTTDTPVTAALILIQPDLAKRLDTTSSAIARRKAEADFTEWSQNKDPDGLAWRYDEASKMFTTETDTYTTDTPATAALSLIQSDLARRLDTTSSTIARRKNEPDFVEWSQTKDPDGLAWRYDDDSKLFTTVAV